MSTECAAVKKRLRICDRIKQVNGVLYRSTRDPEAEDVLLVIPPKRMKASILEAVHDPSGNQGEVRTLALLKKHCFWINMQDEVKQWILTCVRRIEAKAPTPSIKPPIKNLLAKRP